MWPPARLFFLTNLLLFCGPPPIPPTSQGVEMGESEERWSHLLCLLRVRSVMPLKKKKKDQILA